MHPLVTRLTRRYTAREITTMRETCKAMIFARHWGSLGISTVHADEQAERMLLTYMSQGVQPGELKAELKRIKAEERPNMERWQKEIEARCNELR